jgi:uncharacterized protein YegL
MSDEILLAEFREVPAYDSLPLVHGRVPVNVNVPDSRILCVLLLDISGSMSGRVGEIERILPKIQSSLASHKVARVRVELAVATFNDDTKIVHDFALPNEFKVPTLRAEGGTSMGKALMTALDLIEARKSTLAKSGIEHARPWLILMTDGGNTDDVVGALERIQDYQAKKKVVFLPFAISTTKEDFQHLQKVSHRTLLIDDSKLQELGDYIIENILSASESGEENPPPLTNPSNIVSQLLADFMNP